jgi:hypothetical protein
MDCTVPPCLGIEAQGMKLSIDESIELEINEYGRSEQLSTGMTSCRWMAIRQRFPGSTSAKPLLA